MPTFLSIIIPCYNESERIPLLIDALKEFGAKASFAYEVIVVDDGSTDISISMLEGDPFICQLRSDNQFTLIKQSKNKGKGEALKAGIAQATGQFLLTMDGDLSTNPLEIINWLKKYDNHFPENTLFIGSREHPDSIIKADLFRRFIGRIFNRLVRSFLPLTLKDTQCGFKLYPNKIGKQLFGTLENTGWAHDVELLYRAHLQNIVIKEMSIRWENAPGSKISVIKDSIGMLKELLFTRVRSRSLKRNK